MEIEKSFQAERAELIRRVFETTEPADFQQLSLDVFRYQYQYNGFYQSWCRSLGRSPDSVIYLEQIPYLPVSFFKHQVVRTGNSPAVRIFKSSGTSGQATSSHHVPDLSLYERSALGMFRRTFGEPENLTILALLPSYLERGDSSLVYMCDMLIRRTRSEYSGFYLNQFNELKEVLEILRRENRKVWLIGVSFALLDFSELRPAVWPELMLVETGGMKGRRKEMIREELHDRIRENWPLEHIYSEYGMTELLSQAYALKDGVFACPPWMKVRIRDSYDPFSVVQAGQSGGIDVCDLANLDSCAFISTEDLGRMENGGKFRVIGRSDHAMLRGCNLLHL